MKALLVEMPELILRRVGVMVRGAGLADDHALQPLRVVRVGRGRQPPAPTTTHAGAAA